MFPTLVCPHPEQATARAIPPMVGVEKYTGRGARTSRHKAAKVLGSHAGGIHTSPPSSAKLHGKTATAGATSEGISPGATKSEGARQQRGGERSGPWHFVLARCRARRPRVRCDASHSRRRANTTRQKCAVEQGRNAARLVSGSVSGIARSLVRSSVSGRQAAEQSTPVVLGP